MAGEFPPIVKDVAYRKRETVVKLIYSMKPNLITSFFLFFSQLFEEYHKMRSFLSSFGCTFGSTKSMHFRELLPLKAHSKLIPEEEG